MRLHAVLTFLTSVGSAMIFPAMSKQSKKRGCPAAHREITSAECGGGRHTLFACPETCPFNPFSAANYEQLINEIEQAFDLKFIAWMRQTIPNRAQFESKLERFHQAGDQLAYFQCIIWNQVFQVESSGDTCIGRWIRAGLPGLKADERTLALGHSRTRAALLEVRRILDDRRVEVVDLLNPQSPSFILADRELAKMAVRFMTFCGFIRPLPHFYRTFGAIVRMPEIDRLDPLDIVLETVRHLDGPTNLENVSLWLAENMVRLEKALNAVHAARYRQMLTEMDAKFGRALYQLNQPLAECRQCFDTFPNMDKGQLGPEDVQESYLESWDWLAQPADRDTELFGQGAVLGHVLIGETQWCVKAMGGEKLDTLRQRFESHMGNRVRFIAERRDDLAARTMTKAPAYDASLVPPRLLENPQQIGIGLSRIRAQAGKTNQELLDNHNAQMEQRFLDNPLPAFNGKTPREAAQDPALRPELVRMMKARIRTIDQENLKSGRTRDLNWMLRELGLTEILVDAPPPRNLPPREMDEVEEDGGANEIFPHYTELPLPPPLPDAPWDMETALELYKNSMDSFPQISEALGYFNQLEYPLLDDVCALTDQVQDREYQFLSLFIARIILCFAPKGTRPPEVDPGALPAEFRSNIQDMLKVNQAQTENLLAAYLDGSSQPHLLTLAIASLLKIWDEAPAKIRPREDMRTIAIIILKSVINVLDTAMRQRR